MKLLDDMAETMYGARGVGLAASQIGVDKRVAVIDISPRNTGADEEGEEGEEEEEGEGEGTEYEGPGLIELINPEIISSEGQVIAEEACLSIPGFTSDVKRKQRVVIEAYDREGRLMEIEASELLARVFQHEIDHLDGTLFIDRADPHSLEWIMHTREEEMEDKEEEE